MLRCCIVDNACAYTGTAACLLILLHKSLHECNAAYKQLTL